MKTWDEMLISSIQHLVDKVPMEYKTTKQLAAHFKKSIRSVDTMMLKLNVPFKEFKIRSGKRTVAVRHWKL